MHGNDYTVVLGQCVNQECMEREEAEWLKITPISHQLSLSFTPLLQKIPTTSAKHTDLCSSITN